MGWYTLSVPESPQSPFLLKSYFLGSRSEVVSRLALFLLCFHLSYSF